MNVRALVVIAGLLALASCASIPSSESRRALADSLAAAQNWQAVSLPTTPFEMIAYLPRQASPSETLTVYIEGDGFAWVNSSLPSLDPTPRDPIGLKLALRHPTGNAAYLARPCQFIGADKADRCGQRYWTEQRFAPEVIAASSQALDALKARLGAQKLALVGYSGGAAVAALLAAQRQDVVSLVTVAGNLDHRAWTSHHRLPALRNSLNPADYRDALANIPQRHFVGRKDMVIPPSLVEAWASAFAKDHQPEVRIIDGFDHICCWVEHWPELFKSELRAK